ncbi:MAG: transposase [Pyrinomonadaceae bacterium]|nr:transposase [Pyrinomonadaceae bacterium]
MTDTEKIARDLALMLIYLWSWEEGPFKARRCWKGFRFEVLDELAAAGLVSDSKRAKSLFLTAEGEQVARDLLSRYYGIEPET